MPSPDRARAHGGHDASAAARRGESVRTRILSPISILALIGVLLLLPLPARAARATLTVDFTNNGEPLKNPLHGKFYIYEPEKRESYLDWGHAGRPARVPEGIYDVVILYHNDTIREERVLEKVELAGDTELSAEFHIPVAELTVRITQGGQPVLPGSARYRVFRAGHRENPVASRRPGLKLAIRPGLYDIEITHRGAHGLQSRWIENYDLEGAREETIDVGSAAARLVVSVVNRGRPLPARAARWSVYRSGNRDKPIAERRSGESLNLDAGRYDIAVSYDDGSSRARRWLIGVQVSGDTRKEVDISVETASLRVEIRNRRLRLDGAWFEVYKPGDPNTPLASGLNGAETQLEPGIYDVHCTVRRGGVRAERWVRGHEVSGRSVLPVDMGLNIASLRVNPPDRRSRRGSGARSNILFVVDSSADMSRSLGARSRMEQLTRLLEESMRGLTASPAMVGLRVYGIAPRTRRDCKDSSLLLPLERLNERVLSRSLQLLRPAGYSPIAYSLEQAAEDFPEKGENAVVLAAGGPDDCGGDVCAAASELVRSGTVSRIFVIALDLSGSAQRSLDCAGTFHAVTGDAELRSALRATVRDAQLLDLGSVNIFAPDGGGWIAGGFLRERIAVISGTYDVQVRFGDRIHTWKNLEIEDDVEAEVGPSPPRSR